MLSTALPKLSRLSILYLSFTAIPTTHALNIFERANAVCGGISGLSQCGDSYPSDFCCGADTTCTRLNVTDAAAVVCCPKGSDCSIIQPTTCDVSDFNATLHPDNQIHLANTTSVTLPKCGDKCCPLGYSCSSNMCIADASSTTPSSSTTASSTSVPTSSATDAPSASQTEAPPIVQASCGFDGKAFAAGFFPGIVLGALGTLALLWLINKRRDAAEKNRYSGDFGHVARQISDPIYDPAYAAARTDFVRRGSNSAQPSPSSTLEMVMQKTRKPTGQGGTGGVTPKIKSLWERTPKLGFGSSPKLGGQGNFSRLPANGLPKHPAPAVRAGKERDPYKTPTRTPQSASTATALLRSGSSTAVSQMNGGQPAMGMGIQYPGPALGQVQAQRPQQATRSQSSETIDVLMRPPSFLHPPRAPGMRENRMTQDSSNTTFTKLMERAGFEGNDTADVRNFSTPR